MAGLSFFTWMLLLIVPLRAVSVDPAVFSPGEHLGGIEVCEDRDGTFSVDSIPTECWHEENRSNIGYRHYPVWSRVTLRPDNRTHAPVILKNPRPGIDAVDLYLFEEKRLIGAYRLGDTRTSEGKQLFSRYSAVEFMPEAGKTYSLLSRIQSRGPVEVGWVVENTPSFVRSELIENIFLGVFAGIVFTLVVYNFSLFLTLGNPFFLVYSLLGIVSLAYQGTVNNLFILFDSAVLLEGLNRMIYFLNTFSFVLPLVFGMTFFETRKSMPWLHRLALVLIVYSLLPTAALYFYPQELIKPAVLSGPLLLLFGLFGIGFRAYRLQKTGAVYFLGGQMILILSYTIQMFGFIPGLLPFDREWLFAVVPIGTMTDIILLSLAQNLFIHQIREQKEQYRLASLARSRFIAVGKSIGNITHQWKLPLVRLGSSVAEMEAERLFNTPEVFYEHSEKTLEDMKEHIDSMKAIIREFGTFYRVEKESEHFTFEAILDDVLTLLASRISESHITVEKNGELSWEYFGRRVSLSHVLWVILDNAVEILEERRIKHPKIRICVSADKEVPRITIEDNGGGIRVKPIEAVFEGFVSDKEQKESTGSGLMIAKMLIDDHLRGKLHAENSKNGARFTIILPASGGSKKIGSSL